VSTGSICAAPRQRSGRSSGRKAALAAGPTPASSGRLAAIRCSPASQARPRGLHLNGKTGLKVPFGLAPPISLQSRRQQHNCHERWRSGRASGGAALGLLLCPDFPCSGRSSLRSGLASRAARRRWPLEQGCPKPKRRHRQPRHARRCYAWPRSAPWSWRRCAIGGNAALEGEIVFWPLGFAGGGDDLHRSDNAVGRSPTIPLIAKH
jgi:hypothetical protein